MNIDRALTVTKSTIALALIGAALWTASDDYVDLDTPCDTACSARMKSDSDAYAARIVDEQVATLSRGATCTDAQPTTLPDFLLVQGAALGSQRVVSRMTVDQVFAVAQNASKADDVWVIRACVVK